jgi:hypothetical protein
LGFEELTFQQFKVRNPDSVLTPAEFNFYLNVSVMNMNSIENVIDQVRELKMEIEENLEKNPVPPPKMPVIVQNGSKILNLRKVNNIDDMKESGFNQEMTRIKNTIEALKRGFKMTPKIQIIIHRNIVYSNNTGKSNKL